MADNGEHTETIDPHPWYLGGCDALGPNGQCVECMKLTGQPQSTNKPFIAGRPTEDDLLWLCRHPQHTLAMVEIEGAFVPIVLNEAGEGPVIPEISNVE